MHSAATTLNFKTRHKTHFLLYYLGISNGKSLERARSVTGEVVLCSGLVDDGRCSQEIHGTSFYHYLTVPHVKRILS